MSDIIGSVASILQLVEQGLQVTRVCYTFLHDIKNAPEDVMVAVEEFNSIVDLFSTLQIHIEELKSVANARGEQPAIPVSVARAARRLYDLVLQFRALLRDDRDKVLFYRRVTWVLDAKRRDKLLQNLDRERCKLQGALLLSIDRTLRKHVTARRTSDDFQKQQLEQIILGQAGLLGSSASIIRLQNSVSSRQIGLVSQHRDMITQLGNTIESGFAKMEDKLAGSQSTIFQSTTAVRPDQAKTGWTDDQIITVVRREMRDMIMAMANAVTDNSRSEQNEKLALRVASEAVTAWQNSGDTKSGVDNVGVGEEAKLPYQRFSQAPAPAKSRTSLMLDEHYTFTSKCWRFRWYIGTFRAQYRRTWRSEFPNRDSVVISVQFVPSIPIIGLRADFGSSSWPTAFAELSTSIRPLNVISKDAPIFRAIRAHDRLEVRKLLSERLASPFDIDPDGYTPLHRAAIHGDPTICQDLISLQADVNVNVTSLDPRASTRPVDLLHVVAFIKDFTDFGDKAEYDTCLRVLDRHAESDVLDGESEEMSNLVFFMGSFLEKEHINGNIPRQLPGFAEWLMALRERGRKYSIPQSYDERFIQLHEDACSTELASLFRCWFQCQLGVSPNLPSLHSHQNCLHFLAINGSQMTKSLFLAKLKLFLDNGADLYMLATNGQLPIVTAWKFGCANTFKEGLKDYGIDLDKFERRCRDVWSVYRRRKVQEEGMIDKAGGGLSTTWALDDLVPSSAVLLARRPYAHVEAEY